MRKGRIPFIITFLAPALLLYLVFVLSPFAQGIQVSFTNWTGFTPDFDYVGLANYEFLMQSGPWWHAVVNNLKFLLVLPLGTLAVSLVFAALLTRGGTGGSSANLRGSGFYRIVYFFPQVLPVVLIGILFQFVYSTDGGLLQQTLKLVGIDMLRIIPNGLLGTPDAILWAIAFVAIWAGVGFYMVLFIAGMQQIPRELFEAAAIDGASRTRMFFSVTLPLLWGHLQVAVVFIATNTLDMFALLSVMAQNGNGADRGADVMATQLYRTAFAGNSQFGLASAMATFLLVFSLLLAAVTFRLTRRERLEY
ncbi:carbohydrate ABC transporter permease [Flindersiella endophytica]